ncbi:MAG: hypothetical protein V4850_14190 [Myxococcota bacterium]
MNDDRWITEALRPVPLEADTAARIRARLGVEVAKRRARVLDSALHAGFAVAAVAWAVLVVVVR